jgi:hypothetical protein
MIRRDVEHLEVRGVAFDLRPLVGHEPELAEYLRDPADRLRDRVEASACDRPAGRRDVHRLGGEARRQGRLGRALPGARERALDGLSNLVDRDADTWPVVGGKLPDPAHEAGECTALPSEVGDVELVERHQVRRGRDLRQRLLTKRAELAGQRGEVHERRHSS